MSKPIVVYVAAKKIMSNMSYCRFQNTLPDLQDCYDKLDELLGQNESELSDNDQRELRCSKRLIKLCVEVALNYGQEVGQEVDLVREQAEAA